MRRISLKKLVLSIVIMCGFFSVLIAITIFFIYS